MSIAEDVWSFFNLIESEPTLLREAPNPRTTCIDCAVDSRSNSDSMCLKCGKSGERVVILEFIGGQYRWLDLCTACYIWVRKGLDEAERLSGGE